MRVRLPSGILPHKEVRINNLDTPIVSLEGFRPRDRRLVERLESAMRELLRSDDCIGAIKLGTVLRLVLISHGRHTCANVIAVQIGVCVAALRGETRSVLS